MFHVFNAVLLTLSSFGKSVDVLNVNGVVEGGPAIGDSGFGERLSFHDATKAFERWADKV